MDQLLYKLSQLGLSSRSSFKKTCSCTDIERPCMDPDGSDLVGAQMPYMASDLKVDRQRFPLSVVHEVDQSF
ncbi:hypothetical protein SADUNF_Sadunf06G0146800 [Salix dunnii]|uniref:Uncharacterized protein n=1 Tax=Salix dunnii TaxID=1413687 RepID=A0A835K4R7_9ROSI|nr:hypothetical protein SADUNF_Sadunf06G0146800 [Salix dunnii]